MKKVSLRLGIMLILATGLSACGLKYDLYLPEENVKAEASAVETSAPEEDGSLRQTAVKEP